MYWLKWHYNHLKNEYGITPIRVLLVFLAMLGVWLMLVGAWTIGAVLAGGM